MAVTIEGETIEIVDAHTHMGTRPQREQWKSQASDPTISRTFFARLDISEMLQKMSDAGVDAAVAFPMGGFSTEYDYADQNDQIAEAMRSNPGKILGFCRINPNTGAKATRAAVDSCLGEKGLLGIKLHPDIDYFDSMDKKLVGPIFEGARDHRAPIIFHTGGSPNCDPLVIAELAASYPEVPVILGHMGLVEGCKKATLAAMRYPNIYLETSTVYWMAHYLAPAILKVGPERILYGSDYPYNPFQMEIEKLTKYVIPYTGLGVKELRMILGGNIRRLVGAVKK